MALPIEIANFAQSSTNDWLILCQQYSFYDEAQLVAELRDLHHLDDITFELAEHQSRHIIEQVRLQTPSLLQSLLNEYSLSSDQGLAILTLAEAAIRINDAEVLNDLINQQLTDQQLHQQLHQRHGIFAGIANKGLLWAKKIQGSRESNLLSWLFDEQLHKLSLPVIRKSIQSAVQLLARHYVYAETLPAVAVAQKSHPQAISLDMLGEAALSFTQADEYFSAYQQAIQAAACQQDAQISIKLSALHPNYDTAHYSDIRELMFTRLYEICLQASQVGISVTFDAEEQNRLELQLDLVAQLMAQPELQRWAGLSVAVQAYSKRCIPVLYFLASLAKEQQVAIGIRLVKGAYWDSEIKAAQQQCLPDYPVFTVKAHTDCSYLVATQCLIDLHSKGLLIPKFATHNAFHISLINQILPAPCEFQRLHGMGERIHIAALQHGQHHSRSYAPVGKHAQLLPYLLRRIMENSANQSFIQQLQNNEVAIEHLLVDPFAEQSKILPPPKWLFKEQYLRAVTLPIAYLHGQDEFVARNQLYIEHQWHSQLPTKGVVASHIAPRHSHFDKRQLGQITWADDINADELYQSASDAQQHWQHVELAQRQLLIAHWLELIHEHQIELCHLLQCEAGKTQQDALDEWREGLDLVQFYLAQSKLLQPQALSNVTGERNECHYLAKGVVLCISPWNFPLAIYLGQISAALLAGNAVIAKPAPQTALMGARLIELAHQAGLHTDLLQGVITTNQQVLDAINAHRQLAMICFTGSSQTAKSLQARISQAHLPFIGFNAETSGINMAIVEGSAYLDQVVRELTASVLVSAGQRCSCIRQVWVEHSIYAEFKGLLTAHWQSKQCCSPLLSQCDVPPIIDANAWQRLAEHADVVQASGVQNSVEQTEPYFAPLCIESDDIQTLELFGPLLTLTPYKRDQLATLCNRINQQNASLTMAVFSRNQRFIEQIRRQMRVGNLYVNRSSTGAMVAAQPFGGFGWSGSGEKAGSADYILNFVYQSVHSINTAALGGNLDLLSQ